MTLAGGIATLTSAVALVIAGLSSATPFPNAKELVWLTNTKNGLDVGISRPSLLDLSAAHGLRSVGGFSKRSAIVKSRDGLVEEVTVAIVTQGFFETLFVPALRGRFLGFSDDQSGANPVAVISYRYWRSGFASSDSALGASLRINDVAYTVVGIAPARLTFPDEAVIAWLPASAAIAPIANMRAARVFWGLARTNGTASLAAVRHEAAAIHATENRSDSPASLQIGVWSLRDWLTRPMRTRLVLIMGVAVAVLMLSMLSVATLLSTLVMERRGEYALRLALGATTRDLTREVIASLLPIAAGGLALGWAVSWLLIRRATGPSAPHLPELQGAAVGAEAMLTSLCAAATMLMGVVILARFQLPKDPHVLWPTLATTVVGTQNAFARKALAVTGLGVAFPLVAVTIVLAMSFVDDRATGFAPVGVHLARLTRPITLSTPSDQVVTRELVRQFVTNASSRLPRGYVAISTEPPGAVSRLSTRISLDSTGIDDSGARVGVIGVTSEYFKTLQIPLRTGRPFGNEEVEGGSALAAILDDRAAALLFADTSVLGTTVRLLDLGLSTRVVGTVPAIGLGRSAATGQPTLYVPYERLGLPWVSVLVRSEDEPTRVQSALVQAARRTDPSFRVGPVLDLYRFLLQPFEQSRFYATVVGATGVMAVFVSAFGLFSVMSLAVSQRSRELAVRVCLGASRRDIGRLILAEVLQVLLTTVLVGVPSAIVLASQLNGQFPGVGAIGIGVLAQTTAFFMLVIVLAVLAPLRRAISTSPQSALRQ